MYSYNYTIINNNNMDNNTCTTLVFNIGSHDLFFATIYILMAYFIFTICCCENETQNDTSMCLGFTAASYSCDELVGLVCKKLS